MSDYSLRPAQVASSASHMNLFERYLTLWVALCIAVGIALGAWLPSVFQTIGRMEIAQINLREFVQFVVINKY